MRLSISLLDKNDQNLWLRIWEERTKNVWLDGKSRLLEESNREDRGMGERGQGQAAVAGGHINMKARVVTSSWFSR